MENDKYINKNKLSKENIYNFLSFDILIVNSQLYVNVMDKNKVFNIETNNEKNFW
jgi:hypothetical protein